MQREGEGWEVFAGGGVAEVLEVGDCAGLCGSEQGAAWKKVRSMGGPPMPRSGGDGDRAGVPGAGGGAGDEGGGVAGFLFIGVKKPGNRIVRFFTCIAEDS